MNRNWFWRVLNVMKLLQKQRERPSEPDWALGELRLPCQAAVWVKQKPEWKWKRAVSEGDRLVEQMETNHQEIAEIYFSYFTGGENFSFNVTPTIVTHFTEEEMEAQRDL